MATSRDERMSVLAHRMQAVFEVRWDPGITAGDAFESAREALAASLELDLRLVREVTFDRFASRHLHQGVSRETVMQPVVPDSVGDAAEAQP